MLTVHVNFLNKPLQQSWNVHFHKSYVDAQNSFLKTKGHPLLASPTTFWGPKLSFAYICSISIFHLPTGKTFFRFQKKFFDKVAIY